MRVKTERLIVESTQFDNCFKSRNQWRNFISIKEMYSGGGGTFFLEDIFLFNTIIKFACKKSKILWVKIIRMGLTSLDHLSAIFGPCTGPISDNILIFVLKKNSRFYAHLYSSNKTELR